MRPGFASGHAWLIWWQGAAPCSSALATVVLVLLFAGGGSMPSLHWVALSRDRRGAGISTGVLVMPAMSAALCSCIQAKWLLSPACSALLLFLLCSSAANGVVKPGAVRMPGTVEAKAFHIKPQAPKPAYLTVSKAAGPPAECKSLGDCSLST